MLNRLITGKFTLTASPESIHMISEDLNFELIYLGGSRRLYPFLSEDRGTPNLLPFDWVLHHNRQPPRHNKTLEIDHLSQGFTRSGFSVLWTYGTTPKFPIGLWRLYVFHSHASKALPKLRYLTLVPGPRSVPVQTYKGLQAWTW